MEPSERVLYLSGGQQDCFQTFVINNELKLQLSQVEVKSLSTAQISTYLFFSVCEYLLFTFSIIDKMTC